jgi:hypothetical protein
MAKWQALLLSLGVGAVAFIGLNALWRPFFPLMHVPFGELPIIPSLVEIGEWLAWFVGVGSIFATASAAYGWLTLTTVHRQVVYRLQANDEFRRRVHRRMTTGTGRKPRG